MGADNTLQPAVVQAGFSVAVGVEAREVKQIVLSETCSIHIAFLNADDHILSYPFQTVHVSFGEFRR